MEFQYSSDTRLEWTVHPIKRNWKVSVGVITFLVALCATIYFSFNSLALLALSVTILVCSLAPFFFPTTYTLQDDCIIVKSLLRRFSKEWASFKSYYPDRNGILLSPFPSPSRLENFRGIYVRFWYNKTEVVDFIKERIKNSSTKLNCDK
jgi:hypothetical protein